MLALLNDPADKEPPEVAELREEIDEVERQAARRIELGSRGFLIACLVFGLIVSLLLPWVGDYAGWQVLAGEGGPVPRLFAVTASGFGILGSALTVVTRRWWLAWVCAVGSCIATVDGLLAIWSQQSSGVSGVPGEGPGIGMVIALIVMIMLAGSWLRTAWSRT
ncbi:MAG: Rv2732c family membrane protein [Haloechinothrix sp.]